MKRIVVARHIVGISAVLLCSPLKWFNNDLMAFLTQWAVEVICVFGSSAIITGLLYLFFTERMSEKTMSTARNIAWIFTFLLLLDPWIDKIYNDSYQNAVTRVQERASDGEVSLLPEKLITPELATEKQVEDATAQVVRLHYEKIYAAHPNADLLSEELLFVSWAGTAERAIILKEGTTEEIITLFDAYVAYKANLATEETRQHRAAATVVASNEQPEPEEKSRCKIYPVMTNDDYRACGITPPQSK